MPELPEVETVARSLSRRVKGDVIESVWIGNKSNLLKSPAAEIADVLTGAKIVEARRVGKHIVVDLKQNQDPSTRVSRAGKEARELALARDDQHDAQWIIHLGMTGSVLVGPPDAPLAKHTHLIAKLASGRELRFVDPRRFGKLAVRREEQFAAPGMEPLYISVEDFAKLFHGRKTPIKSALLNQSLLSGVGNIYADEALARTKIRPRRRAASLTRDELKRLHANVQKVLRAAIKAGGSSISDYVDADGERGFFQIQHWVYRREGEPCRNCKTPIKRIVIAGRSAHYCPKCQK